jgi:hypothetical protein
MLSIQLTEKDILAAHLAHMASYRFAPLIAAGCALVAGLAFVVPNIINPAWALFAALIAVWFLAARYVLLPRKARRLYRQRKAFQRPFEVSWDEAGLTMVSSSGTVTTPWSDFLKLREGAGVVLLYLSDTQFHIIPARAFVDTAAADAFAALVRGKIG